MKKRASQLRKMQLQALADCVKKGGETYAIVAGDFNESACSENMQNFMSET